MATRRQTLQGLAVGFGLAACRGTFATAKANAAYIGIETHAVNRLSLASFFSSTGERLGSLGLDFRAHGIANHKEILAVFPRRPGNRFAIVDTETMLVRGTVTAPSDVHFCGHGAFTLDGAYLLVTENHFEKETSAIGIYELADEIRRIDQLTLPLPGPHEIVRHPLRNQFYVALGGLYTHPDYGRVPLNMDSFESQVVEFSTDSYGVNQLGVWQNTAGISLRHLAIDTKDRLYVGGQIKNRERIAGEHVLWLVKNGQEQIIEDERYLAGYVSSISASESFALISSKESHAVLRVEGNKLLEKNQIVGASSVAAYGDLAVQSGFELLKVNDSETQVLDGYEFDNHGLILTA